MWMAAETGRCVHLASSTSELPPCNSSVLRGLEVFKLRPKMPNRQKIVCPELDSHDLHPAYLATQGVQQLPCPQRQDGGTLPAADWVAAAALRGTPRRCIMPVSLYQSEIHAAASICSLNAPPTAWGEARSRGPGRRLQGRAAAASGV